jgi:hypothetical protein
LYVFWHSSTASPLLGERRRVDIFHRCTASPPGDSPAPTRASDVAQSEQTLGGSSGLPVDAISPSPPEPLTLLLITGSYHLVGLVTVAVIVSVWRPRVRRRAEAAAA